MGLFDRFREPEMRNISVSASNFLEFFNLSSGDTATGESVTTDSALKVPAVWAAVNFISGTLAGLPLHVYQRTRGGERTRVRTGLAPILHDAVNDETTSFDWRKHKFENVLTGGRAFTFIERNKAGKVMNLWPLDPTCTTIKKRGGRKYYEYKEGEKSSVYEARDIIDIPFMFKSDGLGHRGPIVQCRDAISLALSSTKFGGRFFANGGVPPFAVTGNFQSGKAMDRASDDLHEAVKKAAKEKRHALTLPSHMDVKKLGADLNNTQFVELQRFLIEECARIYSLPPVFLQDLTHGTFTNTEQQDLQVTKHTLRRWVEQFEQELNLKLFGRANKKYFVEFNLDGLLRGDFKTRMEGYSSAVQNGIMKPNEARRKENLPEEEAGKQLMIQGATVPIGTQSTGDDTNG